MPVIHLSHLLPSDMHQNGKKWHVKSYITVFAYICSYKLSVRKLENALKSKR